MRFLVFSSGTQSKHNNFYYLPSSVTQKKVREFRISKEKKIDQSIPMTLMTVLRSSKGIERRTKIQNQEGTYKKKSKMKLTPLPLRIIMCSMYFEIFRLGVVVCYYFENSGSMHPVFGFSSERLGTCEEFVQAEDLTASFFARASDACIFYTLTYAIDTFLAFSGYMSMYKHRMKHVEHHAFLENLHRSIRSVSLRRMIYKTVRSSTHLPTSQLFMRSLLPDS